MKTYKVIVDDRGDIRWFNEKGQYHREDGPAIESKDGSKLWWLNGIHYKEEEWKEKVNKPKELFDFNELAVGDYFNANVWGGEVEVYQKVGGTNAVCLKNGGMRFFPLTNGYRFKKLKVEIVVK